MVEAVATYPKRPSHFAHRFCRLLTKTCVANELGTVGPLWMGIVIAAFFHALNLALAGFSPMIQALRLHYVEFFSKFVTGGGRPFRPFGRRPPKVSPDNSTL